MYVYRSKVVKLLTITNLGRWENYREFKYSFLYSLMYSKLSISSVCYFKMNKYTVIEYTCNTQAIWPLFRFCCLPRSRNLSNINWLQLCIRHNTRNLG